MYADDVVGSCEDVVVCADADKDAGGNADGDACGEAVGSADGGDVADICNMGVDGVVCVVGGGDGGGRVSGVENAVGWVKSVVLMLNVVVSVGSRMTSGVRSPSL